MNELSDHYRSEHELLILTHLFICLLLLVEFLLELIGLVQSCFFFQLHGLHLLLNRVHSIRRHLCCFSVFAATK